jgi:hypothetical protein
MVVERLGRRENENLDMEDTICNWNVGYHKYDAMSLTLDKLYLTSITRDLRCWRSQFLAISGNLVENKTTYRFQGCYKTCCSFFTLSWLSHIAGRN